MLALWWPVVLIVVADVIYQICAKKLSSAASPLAALGATYLVSALTCVLLFEVLSPAGDLMAALAVSGGHRRGLHRRVGGGDDLHVSRGLADECGIYRVHGDHCRAAALHRLLYLHGTDGAYEARRGRTHLSGHVLYCKVRRK